MKPKKPKRGRPPLPREKRRVPIEVTLPSAAIERAREIGSGNVSRGIEIALRAS